MASNSSKTPPSLSKRKTYEDWLKVIKVWRRFDLPANRQGSTLVLSLEDEALDTVLEIDNAEIAKDDDVDAIINCLNSYRTQDSGLHYYKIPSCRSI